MSWGGRSQPMNYRIRRGFALMEMMAILVVIIVLISVSIAVAAQVPQTSDRKPPLIELHDLK